MAQKNVLHLNRGCTELKNVAEEKGSLCPAMADFVLKL